MTIIRIWKLVLAFVNYCQHFKTILSKAHQI